jgi:hypothetical protein
LDDEGILYLTLFLQQNSSLIHLNLFNNNIKDEILATLLTALITPTSQFERHGDGYSQYGGGAGGGSVSPEPSLTFSKRGKGQGVIKPQHYSPSASHTSSAAHSYLDILYYNQSLTSLSIGCNEIGDKSCEILERVIKQNTTLSYLSLDGAKGMKPKGLKKITEAIRLYNCYLLSFSLNSIRSPSLSVRSLEYLGKCQGKSKISQIRYCYLSKCQLTSLHIKYFMKFLKSSKSLQTLDLSCNSINDEGAIYVADILMGYDRTEMMSMINGETARKKKVSEEEEKKRKKERLDDGFYDDDEEEEEDEREGHADARVGEKTVETLTPLLPSFSMPLIALPASGPPIISLDLTTCSMTINGCLELLKAMKATNRVFHDLNLSFNELAERSSSSLSPSKKEKEKFKAIYEEFFQVLSFLHIHKLILSSCSLKTKGIKYLLLLLIPSFLSRLTVSTPIDIPSVTISSADSDAGKEKKKEPRPPGQLVNALKAAEEERLISLKTLKQPVNVFLDAAAAAAPSSVSEEKKVVEAPFSNESKTVAEELSVPIVLEKKEDENGDNNEVTSTEMIPSLYSTHFLSSLKSLNLSHNSLSDSITSTLCSLLQENMILQSLDLSFNNLTDASSSAYQEAMKVTSSHPALKKVEELSIDITGNPCNSLLFAAPGMSRSKIRFVQGLYPNRFNSNNAGYDHIDQRARKDFMIRKEIKELVEKNPDGY